MKTNLIAITALSVIPAFSVSAQDKGVLDYVREEANLFSYQLQVTDTFCADMSENVLPVLNALDLSREFTATFDRNNVQCDIRYGEELVHQLSGQSLYSVNRGFDHERIADNIMDVLNTDERLRVAEQLQLPEM